MITVILLHPFQLNLIQSWIFEDESVIRIGRATDNEVVLYSAVVSRRHVELRGLGRNWEMLNLSPNGTYLDGKRINQLSVVDGVIVRLACSGPLLQVRFGAIPAK